MSIDFQLSKKDIMDAIRLELKRPFWMRLPEYLFYVSIVAMILYILALILSGYTQFLVGGLAMIGIFTLMVVNRWVLLPRRAYKNYDTSVELRAPVELVLSEEGLAFTTEFGHSRRNWEHLVGWKESDELLLLYVSDANAHLIPKRVIRDTEALRFIKEKLDEYGIPYRSYPSGSWMAVILYVMLVIIIAVIFFM